MTHRPRNRLLAAVAASAAFLLSTGPSLASAPADRSGRRAGDMVAISVQSIGPTTLPTTAKTRTLTVKLQLANRTTQTFRSVRIEAQRGEPETTQAQLQAALGRVKDPTGHVIAVPAKHPVKVDLQPGAVTTVTFQTTTSTQNSDGLCNCTNPDLPALVYPLYFSAHVVGAGGVDQQLGLTNTFVSAFYQAPAPIRVAWVWPLIDQPHLLDDSATGSGGPVFADDLLAASVATGGRLDRSLAVIEGVAASPKPVPMTLLIDPELLVELEIMATGHYRVRTDANRFAAGTGGNFAVAWLQRLAKLVEVNPQFSLELTPYADPDVESLDAAGLRWQSKLPTALEDAVRKALGGQDTSGTLAWPATGGLSRSTLNALVDQGVSTVLLDAGTIRPKPSTDTVSPGLARLSARGRDIAVGLLDPTLQRFVRQAVAPGGTGASELPLLMSELAIRAVQQPNAEHPVVLTPPRWVDPDVPSAVKVIRDTSRSCFDRGSCLVEPVSLGDAVGSDLLPPNASSLTKSKAPPRRLPAENLRAAVQITKDLPGLRALLTPAKPRKIDASAAQVLDELPLQGQRATASAWGQPGSSGQGAVFAQQLTDQLTRLTSGVTINAPKGAYTLASEHSKLPITVRNNLPWQVHVLVRVGPVNGLAGLTTKDQIETVDGGQKATVRVPTDVVRPGLFQVEATLYTVDGRYQVGVPVTMTVRSTVLDAIGVVIMIVSGTILAIALIIRFGRRLRLRWSRNEIEPGDQHPDDRSAGTPDSPKGEVAVAGPAAGEPEMHPVERAP